MLAVIGDGLIYTFDIGTPTGKWIGYQIIAGFGPDLAIQTPVIVDQSISSRADVGVAMSNVLLTKDFLAIFQFASGLFGTSCAQSIFNNGLIKSLPRLAPGASPDMVLGVGAYDTRGVFSGDQAHGRLTVVYGWSQACLDYQCCFVLHHLSSGFLR
ncbi:hypothetical protein BBP40_011257 [Aspergillus hancockii]|nr:hypothetical protein BBP40_011257 [Aspergillus hancockii]